MAAKPPKPPGNFLKSLLNQQNSNNSRNQQQQQHNNEVYDTKEGNILEQHLNNKATTSSLENNYLESCNITSGTKKANCNCSNISIMHLFHEMKQEFPTIPDTIVAQCVNENCHQRENCIQMLKHELELNPIPAQSYPAKVLHPPNNNSNIQNSNTNNNHNTIITTPSFLQKPPLQQKPLVVQQKPPLKPIKPIRTAPLQPPPTQQQQQQQQNYNNNNCIKVAKKKPLAGENLGNIEKNVVGGGVGSVGGLFETNDVPTKITPQYNETTNDANENSQSAEVCNSNKIIDNNCDSVGDGKNNERNLPRQRPTTLNLKTQQQQQRQRLNVQLQQRFQEQRNRQHQQTQNPTNLAKPLRKAPLPPIAPKPSHIQLNHTNANTNSFLNDSLSSNHNTNTTSPLSEPEISVSVSLSTPSPTSPNTTTHHPLNKSTTNRQQQQQQQQQNLQTKSPIRHRSVITLQPEPPYTRDFLFTPASLTYASSTPSSPSLATTPSATTTIQTSATNSSSSTNSSPTASVAGSQKSFTSVNLTLRPPVSPTGPNSALQPSTIDITAGPGFSGASGGGKSLHYSSTSYDARLGYQQNFQITVTDESGVFSASRIRPQPQQQQQRSVNQVNISKEIQYDGNSDKEPITNNNNFLLNYEHQQQQQLQLQQQFHNNNVVTLQQNIQNSIQQSPQSIGGINTTSSGFGSSGGGGTMCLPTQQEMDAPTQEVLQRQKKKRDKLAAALREYKKRLGNVEQEINLLTGTIPTQGLSERLDEEITKLRRDCQDMLRSSNTFTQPPLQQELAINYQPQQHQQQIYQQQPQPFPRQRITRPPPRPPPPRQTSLDIIQHHSSQTTTPHTLPAASLPNLNFYNSPQQQQQQQQTHMNTCLTSPPFYHQQSAPLNTSNNNDLYNDLQDPIESDNNDYDEYEEISEPWECSMCTFRNHPQLNICETCENVRIIPGRLTNLSRALANTNFTNTPSTTAAAPVERSASANSLSLGLLGVPAGTPNAINNSNSSSRSRNDLNAANGNLEHDTNLVQQQLQHFALHI